MMTSKTQRFGTHVKKSRDGFPAEFRELAFFFQIRCGLDGLGRFRDVPLVLFW